ncbi:hypothetical protein, partial [Sphingomonas aquatica]|uniref:hypothetical protein n=1 Tax=Sphingomonas aquatica TaxID=1763824 RepID=UPI00301C1599
DYTQGRLKMQPAGHTQFYTTLTDATRQKRSHGYCRHSFVMLRFDQSEGTKLNASLAATRHGMSSWILRPNLS